MQKILHLRQNYLMGPWRIRMYLERYHDLVVADATVVAIDPLLRDAFHVLRFPANYESSYAVKYSGDADFRLLDLDTGKRLEVTRRDLCLGAKALVNAPGRIR